MCAPVLIGVNQRGEKHFLAIENGVRESKQSWLEVLLKLLSHSIRAARINNAPVDKYLIEETAKALVF